MAAYSTYISFLWPFWLEKIAISHTVLFLCHLKVFVLEETTNFMYSAIPMPFKGVSLCVMSLKGECVCVCGGGGVYKYRTLWQGWCQIANFRTLSMKYKPFFVIVSFFGVKKMSYCLCNLGFSWLRAAPRTPPNPEQSILHRCRQRLKLLFLHTRLGFPRFSPILDIYEGVQDNLVHNVRMLILTSVLDVSLHITFWRPLLR